jgi:hypothetical protein
MLPSIALIQFENPYRTRFWLPVPLFLLWLLALLLSPLLLLVLLVACLAFSLNPFRVIGVVWGIVSALRGTSIQVRHQANSIHIRVH